MDGGSVGINTKAVDSVNQSFSGRGRHFYQMDSPVSIPLLRDSLL
uniref:Plug domain-containing protein n=1 Tax=Haemonchus contortus TaxID=6289 RepID=A0A7I4XWW2_HAECO